MLDGFFRAQKLRQDSLGRQGGPEGIDKLLHRWGIGEVIEELINIRTREQVFSTERISADFIRHLLRQRLHEMLNESTAGIIMRLARTARAGTRSEEHTSELQSRGHLVCRLLLEKKKKKTD